MYWKLKMLWFWMPNEIETIFKKDC